MLIEDQDMPVLPRVEALDPFGYLPGAASRIGGLADGYICDDPRYVFHTDYVVVGQGMSFVRVSFTGLRAKTGSLLTRVHLLTNDEPPRLILVTSDRTSFNRLMQNGEVVIRFEALRGARYAFYGSLQGETDAEADGLQVLLERPEEMGVLRGAGMEVRNSAHGRGAVRPSSILVSTDRPQIDAPVSQVATAEQLRSESSRAWLRTMARDAKADPLGAWAAAYTLQVLTTFGVATPAARGLGFDAAGGPVARVLADSGVQIVTTSEETHALRTDPTGADSLRVETADRSALGLSLLNFDFLWNHDGRVQASANGWIADMEDTLTALLPGGLGVFTFPFDPETVIRRAGETGPLVIGRAEIERAALALISRGHQLAQLKVAGAYPPLLVDGFSAAGLVVRRALVTE